MDVTCSGPFGGMGGCCLRDFAPGMLCYLIYIIAKERRDVFAARRDLDTCYLECSVCLYSPTTFARRVVFLERCYSIYCCQGEGFLCMRRGETRDTCYPRVSLIVFRCGLAPLFLECFALCYYLI